MAAIENISTSPFFFQPKPATFNSYGTGGNSQPAAVGDYFNDGGWNVAGRGESNAGSVVEVSVQASLSRSFEASFFKEGQNGSQVSAYYKASEEINVTASFRMEQAQALAEAHTAAAENPFGPEATAGRIVDFALSFFPAFARQHSDMSFDEQVDAFKEMVEGAVDKGFKEAMAILGPMPEEITAEIDKTRQLVDSKLASFFEYLKGEGAEKGQQAAQDDSWMDFVNGFFGESNGEQQKAAA